MKIDVGDISTTGGRLSFMVRNPTQVDAAVERMRNLTKPVALTGSRDWDVQVVDSTRVVLTPTPAGRRSRPRRTPPGPRGGLLVGARRQGDEPELRP